MQKIVTYSFELPGNIKHDFEFKLDTDTFALTANTGCMQPDWARLDHHRCLNCPVSGVEYCPVALNICKIVMPMREVTSYETVKCCVVTQERTYTVTTSAQEALRSLMIFVIAASACPRVDLLKPPPHPASSRRLRNWSWRWIRRAMEGSCPDQRCLST